ncbi:polyphosphate polymerase domain-containing protein [Microbacteriaceae bacterium VKM Ac-2855]|nr:polyphosphate polymerase domain-containing protein [Microbacteriaceae bacterium VKM Ac-2855]
MSRLDTFAPISLPELIEKAALQTRVDRKYIVPACDLESVLADLDPGTRILEIDGKRHSDYESIYFDTPELTSYVLAARGRRRRFKIRTRSYLDSGEAYLEVKTRGARSATVKERLEYDIRRRDVLTPEGLAYVAETLEGVSDIDPTTLTPTVITRYARTTLYIPTSESRATIDTGLSWHLGTLTLDRPEIVIVETKSGSRASEVDKALWAHGHRPATLSKYGTGLAAFRDDLPSNKWARTLRQSFTPSAHEAALVD